MTEGIGAMGRREGGREREREMEAEEAFTNDCVNLLRSESRGFGTLRARERERKRGRVMKKERREREE